MTHSSMYAKIDKLLSHPNALKSTDMGRICDKIAWATKWKKLSEEESNILVDKAVDLMINYPFDY